MSVVAVGYNGSAQISDSDSHNGQKSISTRFQVRAAPESWSKYATSDGSVCFSFISLVMYGRTINFF